MSKKAVRTIEQASKMHRVGTERGSTRGINVRIGPRQGEERRDVIMSAAESFARSVRHEGKNVSFNVLLYRPRAVNRRNYFQQRINIRKDDDPVEVIGNFINRVVTDEYVDDEADEDENDIRIIGYQMIPSNSRYGQQRRVRGYHQFQHSTLEKNHAIKKLIMRDFSCVYESLMIVHAHKNNHLDKYKYNDTWVQYVLEHYVKEPCDFQDMILEGDVEHCIKYFETQYGIQVKPFNGYHCVIQLKELIKVEEQTQIKYDYFLVYWQEHVFPCLREKLEEVTAAIVKMIRGGSGEGLEGDKLFCIIPPAYITLGQEIDLYVKLSDEQRQDFQWVFQNYKQHGFNLQDAYVVQGFNRNELRSEVTQQQLHHKNYMLGTDRWTYENFMEWVCNGGEQDDGKQLTLTRIKRAKECIEARRRICPLITDIDNEQWVKDKIKSRQQQFDNIGLLGFDIETCVDTSLSESIHAQRPYAVACWGRLLQVVSDPETAMLKTNMVHDIRKVFTGISSNDCITQFIDWLVENKFMWTDYDVLSYKYANRMQRSTPDVFNYIIAHNGFGFDYRYLYERLHMKCREFKMIGDITNTKCLSGGGLFFYDFSLIYRERLKVLAQTFFPNEPDKQKFDNDDIAALNIYQVREWLESEAITGLPHRQLNDIREYNLQDAKVVQLLAEKFFKYTFTTPFGHGFLPQMFYHSSSALAWDMWLNCFLKTPIYINKHMLEIEQMQKIGGFVCVYRALTGYGLIIDVNSFYPSIMMNKMPLTYEHWDSKAIQHYPEPWIVTKDNIDRIGIWSIYKIKYRFPEDEQYPMIIQKGAQSLVTVRESVDFDVDSDCITGIYVYGETIRASVECSECVIKVFQEIVIHPGDVHNEFIDYVYKKRLEAKQNKDPVMDQFYKTMGNSCFGKHGENYYPHVVFGTWETVSDWEQSLMLRDDIDKESIEIKQILSDEVPLFELRYYRYGDQYMHKGTTMRISNFIMEMARTYLMRIMHALVDKLGKDCVCYCDTDSVMISLDKFDPITDTLVSQLWSNYKQLQEEDQQGAKGKEIVSEIESIIINSEGYKAVLDIKLKDVRRLDDDVSMHLIDQSRLGACKIEKIMVSGMFCGQKQYGVYYIENSQMKEMVKMKGIPKRHRSMQLIRDIAFKRKDNGQLVGGVTMSVTEQWRRLGTGVSIAGKVVVLMPTLTKREHDLYNGSSRPWRTIDDYAVAKEIITKQQTIEKEKYKDLNIGLIDLVKKGLDYLALSEAQKTEWALKTNMKKQIQQDLDTVCEARKRFMIQIPKYKYGNIQDQMLELLMNNQNVVNEMHMFVSRMISLVHKAVNFKKISQKKGLQYVLGDEDSGEFRANMNTEQAAKIISFCLFTHYALTVHVKKQLPTNFDTICGRMKQIVQDYMQGVASDKHERKQFLWRACITCGLQFLAAPISIDGNTNEIPLTNRVRVTNLWRYMNNMLTFCVYTEQNGQDLSFIDTNANKSYEEMFALSNVQQMHFDQDSYGFNFTLDLPQRAEDIINLVNIKEHQDQREKSEEVLEQAIKLYTSRVIVPMKQRLFIDEEQFSQEQQMQTQMMEMKRQMLAKKALVNFGASQPDKEVEKFVEIMGLSAGELNKDQLKKVFGNTFGRGTSKTEITQRDVIDLIMVIQFIKFAQYEGVMIYRRLMNEWKQYTGSKSKLRIFVEVSQLLFQRPSMFSRTIGQNEKTSSSKFKCVVDLLISLIDMGHEEWTDEDKAMINVKLDNVINNDKNFGPQFRDAVILAVTPGSVSYNVGLRYYQHIMQWQNDNGHLQQKLKAILFMRSDLYMKTDVEMVNIESLLSQQMQQEVHLTDDFINMMHLENEQLQNDVKNILDFSPEDYNLDLKVMQFDNNGGNGYVFDDDFVVPDDAGERVDYRKRMRELEEDDDNEFADFFRLKRIKAIDEKYAQMCYDEEMKQNDEFQYIQQQRIKANKKMKHAVSKFLEEEAEEDDNEESSGGTFNIDDVLYQ